MARLLPGLKALMKRGAAVKDGATRVAIQELENWAEALTNRLAKMEAADVDLSGYSPVGHTHPVFTDTDDGMVPAPQTGGAGHFLRDDGTWQDLVGTLASDSWIFGAGGASYTFNGTDPVAGLTPSSGVYTLSADLVAEDVTVNAGVTILTNNWRIICSGTLTNNGTIGNYGADGGPQSSGSARNTGYFVQTIAGGSARVGEGNGNNGFTSNPIPLGLANWASASAGNATVPGQGGKGGDAGTRTGGNGGAMTASSGVCDWHGLIYGRLSSPSGTQITFGSGGGGGALDGYTGFGNAVAPGGGAGGGLCLCIARLIAGDGRFTAHGGNGGSLGTHEGNVTDGIGGGGGGGGGLVVLVYLQRQGPWAADADGGLGGAGQLGGDNGSDGADGSVVLLDLSAATTLGGGGSGFGDGDYGDIVVSGGATAMTIDDGAVTTTKIDDGAVSAAKLGSDVTPAAIGAAEDTHGHAVFDDTNDGFVPASGGGTDNFLRADGTWAAPPGGGGGGGGTGSLSASVTDSGSTVNIESTGTIDWWACNSTTLPRLLASGSLITKKDGPGWLVRGWDWVYGGKTLSLFNQGGGHTLQLTSPNANNLGQSTSFNTNFAYGLHTPSPNTPGFGARLVLPAYADGISRTVRVYGTTYGCSLTVTATLTDGSATPVTATLTSAASTGKAPLVEVTYQAGYGGDLVITMLTSQHFNSDCHVKWHGAVIL